MVAETRQIIKELKAIRSDLDFIKEHVIDLDLVLTDEDLKSLKEAEKDLKEGRTKRLIQIYSVELSQRAQDFLKKLDNHLRIRIENRLKKLANIPVPQDSKFITRDNDDKIFRYRIGDYRALYKLKEQTLYVINAKRS